MAKAILGQPSSGRCRPATSFCQESPKRPPGCPAIEGVSKTPEGKKQREIGLRHVDGWSSVANDGRLTLPGRKRKEKKGNIHR